MTLVQKLGILCLPNHDRVKTGRRSPFYLNCSQMSSTVWKHPRIACIEPGAFIREFTLYILYREISYTRIIL